MVQDADGRNQGDGNSSNSSNSTTIFYAGVAQKSLWAKICQTWILESTGFLVAFLCLAATAAMLRMYDNQVVPGWPVTLNFVLSLFGNVGFAGTLFGVHAAVAQLKWIRYMTSPRPLADLAAFQSVRSGAIGAIRLLFTAGTQCVFLCFLKILGT